MSDYVRSHRWQPTRLPHSWDSPGKNTGVGCHFLLRYGYESWTIKKADHRRFDALELWCWRRLLRVPWTARRSNQLILKEINPQYSLEGLMLKLKFQYFGHLMWRTDSLEKTWCWESLKAGGEGDSRGKDGWMASRTQWTWFWTGSGRWWRTGMPGVLQSIAKSAIWLSNWTTTVYCTEKILIVTCIPEVFG